MTATLAATLARCKHTFETVVDSEHVFGQPGAMHRTYVRRRVIVIGASLALVATTGGSIARAFGAGEPARLASTRTYVVREGDTLWSIVSRVAPDRDPRELIEVVLANDPDAETLVPGQILGIPTSGG